MPPRQNLLAFLALSVALALSPARARAAGAENEPADADGSPVPKVGFMLLGGLALPLCRDQQGCDGNLSSGPSLGGLVAYEPNDRWAIGIAVQASRVHWREPYIGMIDGKTYQIDSDLTAGFAALAARYTPLPQLRVAPIVHAAVGSGFQTQTGTNLHCNSGFIPTGQLAVGARAQASADFSFFGLASATWGFKPLDCAVSDGPGATPFAGWGFGFHVGGAFDLAL
jgi:hypothetical protein